MFEAPEFDEVVCARCDHALVQAVYTHATNTARMRCKISKQMPVKLFYNSSKQNRKAESQRLENDEYLHRIPDL